MEYRDAIEKLKEGNRAYLESGRSGGDVSASRRAQTAEGQSPYAAVVCCSDSRVLPEAIFNAGIGELFVVRTAGNTVGDNELASLSYAAEHLGVSLVVVLGHTRCGAVCAALHGEFDGAVGVITRRIKAAIGEERDPVKAAVLNVLDARKTVEEALGARARIVPMLYDVCSGEVRLL